MGAPRRQKDFIKSRRRVEDDGEEEGSVAAGAEEDSLSEGSVISDADDDADAEGSDGDDSGSPIPGSSTTQPVANGHSDKSSHPAPRPTATQGKPSLTATTGDTETMMNGLKVSEEVDDKGVEFEDLGKQPEVLQPQDVAPQHVAPQDPSGVPVTENIPERRRREHEEYKKKRDADPAFVPNRGGFFMHDHRSAAPGQDGFMSFGRGRGRGIGRPFPSSSRQQPLGPADAPWAHDLHETVAQPEVHIAPSQVPPSGPRPQDQQNQLASAKSQPPNRSFNKTTRIGNVQIRVFLGGMTDPIVFSTVPVNQHTRLPHHRPPLRRDKPVRISLPEMPIRYIFPSMDRSFIFIPRALRPNQQGFGRIRGRGSIGGGYSAFGGPSSRRTSAYAGSAYSPSVALSRRSSLAREVSADGLVSPIGPVPQRIAPVVRLPPAALSFANQQPPIDSSMAPTVNLPQPSAYPLPQKPTFRENRPAALPMHHPKPERTLQVADIDSPATLEFNPPQQQQQLPFHQQVPSQMTGQVLPLEYPHSRHLSHPSQASGGTPLPQILERATHAQPFQPYPFQHPGAFYPQHFPPPMYYYPPPDPTTGTPSAAAPAFVPGQPYQYPMPVAPAPHQQTEPTTQAGMVAHESNGMVYYYDPSQLAKNTPPFPQPGYPMPPPVVGMGGMMTPPIYYPPPGAYYPPQ